MSRRAKIPVDKKDSRPDTLHASGTISDQEFADALRHFRDRDLRRAASICRHILRRDPHHAGALDLYGVVSHQMGDSTLALECFRKAIALNSLNPAYHSNNGVVYQDMGELGHAEACFREALRLRPGYAEAHNNLGTILQRQGNLDEAMTHSREALRLRPDMAEAHRNLGTILQGQGRLTEALTHYREALRLRPGYAEAHNNLGTILQRQGRLTEALDHYREALRLKPDFAVVFSSLGTVFQEQLQLDEAMAYFQRALQIDPDCVVAHWNCGLLSLLTGDFVHGWPEYESRRRESGHPQFSQPRWDGSPLAGQTILLYAEQGLGDTLQFIRYAPLVKQRGATVVVDCQPPLARILATCPGIDALLPHGTPLPHFDVQTSLLSLPGIFCANLDSIPTPIPYLQPPHDLSPYFDEALTASGGALRVGLVWAGNPEHKNDRNRSCSLAYFRPLARVCDVALFSLQKGAAAADLQSEAADLAATDLGPLLGDFADTAAAIARLDLVITVDTAVAHLAGALGKPVWLLLPFAPDWRWLLEREDSPWYPTMRLFRQTQPGDWPGVFDRVGAALVEARPNTVHIRFDADAAFKQIPPTPLCQRGARGDFAGRRPK